MFVEAKPGGRSAKEFAADLLAAFTLGILPAYQLFTGDPDTYVMVPTRDGNKSAKFMKLPRAYARGIFSLSLRRERNPSEAKLLRFHPRAYARGFSRRGIKTNLSGMATVEYHGVQYRDRASTLG